MLLVAGTLVLALPGTGCGGSAATAASGACGPCQAASADAAPNLSPASAKLRALGAKRVELARKRLTSLRIAFDHGSATVDELFAACRDVAFAARDSGLRGGALRDVLQEYRDAVVALKDLTRERAAKGVVGEDAVNRVESQLAEAEFWLAEASQGR